MDYICDGSIQGQRVGQRWPQEKKEIYSPQNNKKKTHSYSTKKSLSKVIPSIPCLWQYVKSNF